ncbi:MAG: hypothetical protein NTW08_05765 [Gammaproteobacteria bacterium]|nr:hypothetical protein [Gammaproteobacteria bacterium]
MLKNFSMFAKRKLSNVSDRAIFLGLTGVAAYALNEDGKKMTRQELEYQKKYPGHKPRREMIEGGGFTLSDEPPPGFSKPSR